MLSNNTIEAVKEIVQIKDVVERYIHLKKSGTRYISNCPFHSERTPSFFISEKWNIYKCFGCGESGDAINFIQKIENVGFIDAIEIIADIYKIPILLNNTDVTQEEIVYNEKKSAEIIFKNSLDFFRDNLKNCEELENYLSKRNISEDIISEFKLGYSNGLLYEFLIKRGLNVDIAIKYGLIRSNFSEVFSKRLIIPLLNQVDKIVGFGARIFIDGDKGSKYINSNDSFLFHKGDFLFNLNNAKKYIQNENKVYIVEGYFDVLSLYSSGVKNVVASCGTALTDSHCKLLSRFTNNIVLFYDNDEAGMKATLSAIVKLLRNNLLVKVVINDKYKDPDEIVNSIKKEDIKEYIEKREVDIVDFYLSYFKYNEESDINKKTNILKSISLYLENIEDSIYRNVLINKLKEATNVVLNIKEKTNIKPHKVASNKDIINLYENEILAILLEYSESKHNDPVIVTTILTCLEKYEFSDKLNGDIFLEYIKFVKKTEYFDIKEFLKYISNDLQKNRIIECLAFNAIGLSDRLMNVFYKQFNENLDKIKNKINYVFLKIRLYYIKNIINDKIKEMKNFGDSDDSLEEIKALKEESKRIAKMLNIAIL